MSFFCDIQESSETVESSGQRTETFTDRADGKNVNCFYIDRSQVITSRSQADVLTYQYNLIFAPGVTIQTKDQVVNIRNKKGDVIEAGPLTVENVATNHNLKGKKHHVLVGLEKRS